MTIANAAQFLHEGRRRNYVSTFTLHGLDKNCSDFLRSECSLEKLLFDELGATEREGIGILSGVFASAIKIGILDVSDAGYKRREAAALLKSAKEVVILAGRASRREAPWQARIALAEAGAAINLVEVDTKAGRIVATGEDYRSVNALGYVPAALAKADAGFEIEIIGERRKAQRLAGAAFDPSGKLMRT